MSVEEIYSQLAGSAAMRMLDALERGEQWAIEARKKWKETGEAPVLKIDSIEEVKTC